MLKNYIIPIQLFIIMEKTNINFWSKNNFNLHFFFFFYNSWLICFNNIIKNELFLSNSYLIELSCLNQNSFIQSNNIILRKLDNIIFYYYYIFFLKIKLFICVSNINNSITLKVKSIDKMFQNANWLERETTEMYNIDFINKKDKRNLLLEYSKIEPILLKNYQVEGLNDIYFNFFENQIFINKNTTIEL